MVCLWYLWCSFVHGAGSVSKLLWESLLVKDDWGRNEFV